MDSTSRIKIWARQARQGRTIAVVLGAGQGGLGVIRGLGRAGIPVLAIGTAVIDFGVKSRFCEGIMVENPQWQDEVLTILRQIAEEIPGTKVIFPDNDKYAEFIYDHVDELSDYVWPMPASREDYLKLTSKAVLHHSAEAAEVPVPATCLPKTEEELRSWCGSARFPVVVKPLDSPAFAHHFKRKGFVADEIGQAVDAFRISTGAGFEVVCQEHIPGGIESLITVYMYRGRRGDEFISFVGKKVRQYPLDLGTASLYVSEWHPKAVELARRLLRKSKYCGVADLEFKVDPRDGTYRLIEVNGRIPMFAGIEAGTGVPLSVHMYTDLLGQSPWGERKIVSSSDQTHWLYALKDVTAAIGLVRTRRMSPIKALRSLLVHPCVYAIWAKDDPAPGVAFIRYFIDNSLSYLRRRKVG